MHDRHIAAYLCHSLVLYSSPAATAALGWAGSSGSMSSAMTQYLRDTMCKCKTMCEALLHLLSLSCLALPVVQASNVILESIHMLHKPLLKLVMSPGDNCGEDGMLAVKRGCTHDAPCDR